MPYEILVHISAPTSKERDDLYRDEALAYRNFKPLEKLFLDDRDGERASHIYRHPRTHALWEENVQVTQRSPLRSFGLDSFSVTEPGSSNQVIRQFETQFILDTQQAIGALDSQISTNTNSFYNGTTLSLTEHRPAKRPRTAEPIIYPLPPESGGAPAPDSPLSFRSSDALNTSFSGFDPISSLLPESYGLSKSGGSNSVQRAEHAANGMASPSLPATPQGLRHEFGRAYYTPEDNDAAALLLGLGTVGTPAMSNNSPIIPPSQNNSPTFRKSRAPTRDRLRVSSLQDSNLSQQQMPNEVSQPLEPDGVECSDREMPFPNFYQAPTRSPGRRLPSEEARSMFKRAVGCQATENDHLPSISRLSVFENARDNDTARSQSDSKTNGLYATNGLYVCERLHSHGTEGHDIAEDQMSSRRSSISAGQRRKSGGKTNRTDTGRTSIRSAVHGDHLPAQKNSPQVSLCGDNIAKTQEHEMTQNAQPDKTGTCLVD